MCVCLCVCVYIVESVAVVVMVSIQQCAEEMVSLVNEPFGFVTESVSSLSVYKLQLKCGVL